MQVPAHVFREYDIRGVADRDLKSEVARGIGRGFATLLGVRWNPIKGDHRQQALKPFVSIGAGPVTGLSNGSFVSSAGIVSSGTNSQSTIGGHFGGGFDVHVARSFSIGLDIGYNVMLNFAQPVGLHDNFNGAQLSLGLGWLFGKGESR